MKSSKNHRARPGLWLILFLITIVIGLVFTGVSIPMQRNGKPAYESYGESSGKITSELAKDFKNTVNVYSDLYNVIVKGEDSQYESGYDALTGRETVNENTNNEADISIAKDVSRPVVVEQSEDNNGIALIEATVVSVIDGDTLDVNIGDTTCRIRLIGVDTPESVHSDPTRNTIWGTYASDHTKEIMNNIPTVYLEYDREPADKYGRTLAYVWLVNDTSDVMYMLNARVVADGYAMDKVYEPNTKYAAQFQKLRETAQESGTGLWSEEGFAELWQNES